MLRVNIISSQAWPFMLRLKSPYNARGRKTRQAKKKNEITGTMEIDKGAFMVLPQHLASSSQKQMERREAVCSPTKKERHVTIRSHPNHELTSINKKYGSKNTSLCHKSQVQIHLGCCTYLRKSEELQQICISSEQIEWKIKEIWGGWKESLAFTQEIFRFATAKQKNMGECEQIGT